MHKCLPVVDLIESVRIRRIIDDDDTLRDSVVRVGDLRKPRGACGVPQMQPRLPPVYWNRADPKIYACGKTARNWASHWNGNNVGEIRDSSAG